MKTPRTQSGVCRAVIALLIAAAATACSGRQEARAAGERHGGDTSATDAPIPATASPYDALPEAVRLAMDKPFTDDFDAMVKRRAIRVAVTFNRTHYFIDQGQERGLTYESLKLFENDLNADLKTGNLKVHVVIVPMSRDQLYSRPRERQGGHGRRHGDRQTRAGEARGLLGADAHQCERSGGHRARRAADRHGGRSRRSGGVRPQRSIYEESLITLNEQLKARGKPPAVFVEAPAVLEDDDVLEMVNAGLAPITIVDDYLAEFWSKVFTSIKVHKDIAVRSGGNLAVAFRKENPKLREVVNTWLQQARQGRRLPKHHRTSLSRQRQVREKRRGRCRAQEASTAVVELFKKYGAQYNIDYLLMAAQGYQESTLDQDVKSPVGAIGVMQVMPRPGRN